MLHPRIRAAAEGELPPWAVAGKKRREHMERVARLLDRWARKRGLRGDARSRWVALGHLHDALRDADPDTLREMVRGPAGGMPGPLLHGPAAAARLREEGVDDEGLLAAIASHTLGAPGLGEEGWALYAADFLEPGRKFRRKWRAQLRERMPEEVEDVVREILRARLRRLLDDGRPVRAETMAFWNELSGGAPWASASEV